MSRLVAAGLIGFALLPAGAAAGDRVTLIVNGTFDVSSLSYAQSVTFTRFVEEGSFAARYEADPRIGADLGVQVELIRGFGLVASIASARRDVNGQLDASIPHPLYFDRDRSASAELIAPGYRERAIHLGLAWGRRSERIAYALFGGASFFTVRAPLVDDVRFTQSYPFDEVTLTGVDSPEQEDSPTGFHVGGRLDWRLADVFGLGAQLRYSGATARLAGVEIDAGGLQLAAGLRLYF